MYHKETVPLDLDCRTKNVNSAFRCFFLGLLRLIVFSRNIMKPQAEILIPFNLIIVMNNLNRKVRIYVANPHFDTVSSRVNPEIPSTVKTLSVWPYRITYVGTDCKMILLASKFLNLEEVQMSDFD